MLDSLELQLQVIMGHLTWVLGTKLDPLEEEQGLQTVEPSLQSR